MKIFRWIIGVVVLGLIVALILCRPLPFLFYQDLPHVAFFGRALFILILACALCLIRVVVGPTAADRIVALNVMGIMIVGLCSVLTISTGRSWYIDIGIAWAIQGFVCVFALSKYLEGKGFDE